jgi:hypothetical protein
MAGSLSNFGSMYCYTSAGKLLAYSFTFCSHLNQSLECRITICLVWACSAICTVCSKLSRLDPIADFDGRYALILVCSVRAYDAFWNWSVCRELVALLQGIRSTRSVDSYGMDKVNHWKRSSKSGVSSIFCECYAGLITVYLGRSLIGA